MEFRILHARSGWASAGGGLLLAVAVARGQGGPVLQISRANPDKSALKAAAAWEEAAAAATSRDDKLRALRQAIEQYETAAKMNPADCVVLERWAWCVAAARRVTTNATEAAALSATGRARFQAAVDCVSTNAEVQFAYAAFLLEELGPIPVSGPDRAATFAQARTRLERIVDAAVPGRPRAIAQTKVASFWTIFAGKTTDDAEALAAYQTAVGLFTAAESTAPALFGDGSLYNVWGTASLHIGRLTKQRQPMERARDLIRLSVAADPNDPLKLYNLACANAILDERPAALASLEDALAKGSRDMILGAVAHDPEWEAIRGTPEFSRAIHAHLRAADAAFTEGLQLQAAGERTAAVSARLEQFQQAITRYAEAVRGRPEFYAAHRNWLLCLQQLISLTRDREKQQEWLRQARPRFAAAAACPEADWRLFRDWAMFLTETVRPLMATSEERRDVLVLAAHSLESAQQKASFSGDRRQVGGDLGRCLVLLAYETPDREDRTRYFSRGVDAFEAAAAGETTRGRGSTYAYWGLALLELARLNGDRATLRQATERLQTAIEVDPRQTMALYNLACCYALLGQPSEALRHLRSCLENDAAGQYRQIAPGNADFVKLRSRPEFRAMFREFDGTGSEGAGASQP